MNKPLILLSLFGISSLSLAADVRLAEFLPGDSWMTMEVEDLDKLKTDFREGPFSAIWEHPGINKTLDEVMDSLPENPENGPSKALFERMKEFAGKISGQVAFSLGGVEKLFEGEEDGDPAMVDVLLLAETEMNSRYLEEFLQWSEKEIKASGGKLFLEKEKLRGKEVFFMGSSESREDEEKRMVCCVVNGMLAFGFGHSVMENLLEKVVEKPSGGIFENPDYREVFEELGTGDVRFFLNFQGLEDLFDFLGKSEDMKIPENPFGVTTKGLIDALGLDGLECLGLGIDFSKQSVELGSAVFMGERDGLLKLMRMPEGDAPLVPFVPAGVATATVSRYDLGQVWPVIEEVLQKVSPALHLMVNSQIAAFETKAGVNVRKDLLGAFGEELVTFSELKPLDPESLVDGGELPMGEFYAISLKDSETFDRALRTLMDTFAPGAELFEDRQHKGVTIRSMRGGEGLGIELSYAVTSKWLLLNVGERSRMLRAIGRLEKSRKSLWNKPSVADALRGAPGGVKQWDYLDLEGFSNFLLPLLDMAFSEDLKLRMELSTKGGKLFDGDLPEIPYFLLGWTRDTKRGFISKAKLYPKGD